MVRGQFKQQRRRLPFNAHGSQSQDGTDGRHVLHIVNELAEEDSERPRVRKQFGHLNSFPNK